MAMSAKIDVGGRELFYEVTGTGPTVVLIHEGIADSRMWNQQLDAFAERHRVVRYDLAGYGQSPLRPGPFSHVRDLEQLLRRLEIERTSLVGASVGGGVALEFALTHPEAVERLVLVGPGLSGHDWSEASQRADEEEERLFAAGDFDGAAEVSLRRWVDGPGQPPHRVDAEIRERVREMTLRSYELYSDVLPEGEPGPVERLYPPAGTRLGEVRAPTLILVGELDVPDILAICDRLETGITGARKVVIRGTAHVPNMERPEEFNRLVLEFLSG